MPAPLFAVAGATLAGGFMQSKSARNASRTASNTADRQMAMQQQMFDEQKQMLAPFLQMGAGNIGRLNMLANQEFDRDKILGDYYDSGEYNIMNDAALRNTMAGNEASGNLNSSAGANALASIAPQLGQGNLATMYAQKQDEYNRIQNLVGMGQSAAAMQGNAMQNFGSQASAIQGQLGQTLANSQIAQGNAMSDMFGNLGGLAYKYMSGSKTPPVSTKKPSIY